MNKWNETEICVFNESNATKATLSALLLFVIIVGGLGNAVMSFLVFRHTEMRSVINILLAVMSISDGFISIFCAPLDLTTVILHKWIFGQFTCFAHSFLLSVFMVQNLFALVIISVDRYNILVNKKSLLRGCNSWTLVIGCFVFAIFTSSPPLFGVGRFAFSNGHCGWKPESGIDDIVYYGLFSSFLLVLPCGLLLLAYIHIIVNLKKTTQTVRPESYNELTPRCLVFHQGIDVRFKQKTFTTILCLYLGIITFKLPMAISLLVKSVTESVVCPVSLWVVVLTYLNSAVNPFIYVFKITTYWMALTGKFYRIRKNVRNWRHMSLRNHPENIYRVSRPSTTSII